MSYKNEANEYKGLSIEEIMILKGQLGLCIFGSAYVRDKLSSLHDIFLYYLKCNFFYLSNLSDNSS